MVCRRRVHELLGDFILPFLHSLPRQSNAKKRAAKYDCWHFATPRDFQLAAVAAETHPAKAGIWGGRKKKEKPASTSTTSKRLNVFDFVPLHSTFRGPAAWLWPVRCDGQEIARYVSAVAEFPQFRSWPLGLWFVL